MSEGYWEVPRWFWYKFAYERGLRVQVLGYAKTLQKNPV